MAVTVVGLTLLAPTAAHAVSPGPVAAACVYTDASHVSVQVLVNLPIVDALVPQTVTVSSNGQLLSTSTSIPAVDGLLTAVLGAVQVPANTQNVTIAVTNTVTNLLGATGSAPCTGLPVESITGGFVTVSPSRVLDTRHGLGAAGSIPAGGTLTVPFAGRGGVPSSGVGAVVFNATETGATAAGFITAYPAGTPRPATSTINFLAGRTIANGVIAKLGSGGAVSFYNASSRPVDLVADVTGYSVGGLLPVLPGTYGPLNPARIADTRRTGHVAPDGTITVQVTGRGGVPTSGVGAVALNLTATNTKAIGFLTVYPGGAPRPFASNLYYLPGVTAANSVVVPVGADGTVRIYSESRGSVDEIVDVVGYFRAGVLPVQTPGLINTLSPSRLLDTRHATGTTLRGRVGAHHSVTFQVSGRGGVPANYVSAAALTLIVTQPAASGYVTAYPSGGARPATSSINFARGQTLANIVVLRLGTGGKVTLYNGSTGAVHLVVDVSGYVTGATVSVG